MSKINARGSAGLFCALLLGLITFWLFHDHPAYLPDDGIYAYGTERLIEGPDSRRFDYTLSGGYRFVPGLIAFSLLDPSLLNLRFPLLLVMLTLCGGAFWLLRNNPPVDVTLGVLVMAKLTVIQFVNPSASWYCLALAMLAALLLNRTQSPTRWAYVWLGVIVGVTFLTRQLNGIVLAAGIVSAVLYQCARPSKSTEQLAVKVLLAPVFLVLAFVSARSLTPGSWLLFVLAPLVLALWQFLFLRVENQKVWVFAWYFSIGAIIAALPAIGFHVFNGSLFAWAEGVLFRSLEFSWSAHSNFLSYSQYPLLMLEILSLDLSWRTAFSALFWLALLLSPLVLGGALIRRLVKHGTPENIPGYALLAVFYAASAVHLQIPSYLFYVSAFALMATIGILDLNASPIKHLVRVVTLATVLIGLSIYAGRPMGSTLHEQLVGTDSKALNVCDLPRQGLKLPADQCEEVASIVGWIQLNSDSTDEVLTLPGSVEFNFLAQRKSPLPFSICAIGLTDAASVAHYTQAISQSLPALLLNRPDDKYQSPLCRQLFDNLVTEYEFIARKGGFDLYSRTDP